MIFRVSEPDGIPQGVDRPLSEVRHLELCEFRHETIE